MNRLLFVIVILFALPSCNKSDPSADTSNQVNSKTTSKWSCVDNLINSKYRVDTSRVIKILESNCNFDKSEKELIEVLFWASKKNLSGIVKLIIDKGINPNTPNKLGERTVLANAVYYKNDELIKFLLSKNTNVDMVFSEEFEDCLVCPDQITVLHQSVIMLCDNFEESVFNNLKLLILESNDVAKKNGQNTSIFEMALKCNSSELLSKLKSLNLD